LFTGTQGGCSRKIDLQVKYPVYTSLSYFLLELVSYNEAFVVLFVLVFGSVWGITSLNGVIQCFLTLFRFQLLQLFCKLIDFYYYTFDVECGIKHLQTKRTDLEEKH
jgi:hypothetical protein